MIVLPDDVQNAVDNGCLVRFDSEVSTLVTVDPKARPGKMCRIRYAQGDRDGCVLLTEDVIAACREAGCRAVFAPLRA